MLSEIMKHDVDYMKLLYDDPNVSVYELDAITLGENDNGLNISRECAERSLKSFANKPLYCVIDNRWAPLDSEHNDFMEHFREEYPDRITRDRILPFGSVPESAVNDATFVERDGNTYLRMNVVVWKRLLPHVSDILRRRDGSVKISVEFIVLSGKQNEDTGIIDVEEFNITAITALGEKFREVMDGCRLKSIKFSYNDFISETNKNYFSFSSTNKYEIPKEVIENINNGILMREKYSRGGTKNIYNSIKTTSEIGYVYESQVIDAQKYFSSLKEEPKETNPPTGKYILYKMYGGEEGKNWFNSIVCNGSAEAIEKTGKGGNRVDDEKEIKIDNSKESAIDSSSWENPGKELYGPIMESKNRTELLNEAYLVVEDGYEDSPSEHLKYPHHEVVDGKLVLNIKGVKAAFSRASQMGIDNGSIKEHLERHYRELGLTMENFEEKFAEMEEKYNSLSKEYEAKCAEYAASQTACAEAESKCAECEAKMAEMQKDIEEKNSRLEKFENAERISNNMAVLSKYAAIFDEETVNALKKCAEEMSCDEMNAKVTSCVMEFAEKSAKESETDNQYKFSYGFPMNQFFNKNSNSEGESELEKVNRKYKTAVI